MPSHSEEDCRGGVIGVDVVGGGGVADAIEVGQAGVGYRDGVGEDDVDFAAELVEDLGERQGRSLWRRRRDGRAR